MLHASLVCQAGLKPAPRRRAARGQAQPPAQAAPTSSPAAGEAGAGERDESTLTTEELAVHAAIAGQRRTPGGGPSSGRAVLDDGIVLVHAGTCLRPRRCACCASVNWNSRSISSSPSWPANGGSRAVGLVADAVTVGVVAAVIAPVVARGRRSSRRRPWAACGCRPLGGARACPWAVPAPWPDSSAAQASVAAERLHLHGVIDHRVLYERDRRVRHQGDAGVVQGEQVARKIAVAPDGLRCAFDGHPELVAQHAVAFDEDVVVVLEQDARRRSLRAGCWRIRCP